MNTILKLDDAISPDLCDACIKFYKETKTYDLSVNPIDGSIHPDNFVSAHGTYNDLFPIDLLQQIHEAFTKIIRAYIDLVPTYIPHATTGYQIREVHGPTKRHWDNIFTSNDHNIRNLSIIAGLNSDFEEGVFNFPQQDYQTRLLRGQAIAFPVYYTHPHEVSSPVGYRYTINTWVTDGTCKASIVNPEEGRRIMEELNEK
mgnify:CR=1 FL=1|tara:strand:+ start:43 stop:645 length:603 start_codon:yes stop_codon:yes gene_type:complete